MQMLVDSEVQLSDNHPENHVFVFRTKENSHSCESNVEVIRVNLKNHFFKIYIFFVLMSGINEINLSVSLHYCCKADISLATCIRGGEW